ncbi:AlbA family DNA-binding domain-containing protein [Bacillus sp. FJAT-18017]|uniref:AlbA family DNA-binding domain-containing protein n=1 Tax=Bacillus sp. FJAT-18017 TaxID=1705566 RepID=UPI0006ADA6D1|nr:ATP-binding protein [Bacillus sp. FJAT-18017]
MDKTLLGQLLDQTESEHLDFKKGLYVRANYDSLLKDVIAMANAKIIGSRYIIFGVKESAQQEKELFNITEPIDAATYQELIFENIEPQLDCQLHYLTYKNHLLAILEIRDPKCQPYLLKKDYNKLHKGFCYIRRGSKNDFATRSDFDYFYKQGQFEIHILDGYLRAVDAESGCASLECSFRNCTDFPITIYKGFLEVWDSHQLRTQHRLFGHARHIPGADYRLEIPPKAEITMDFRFGFESSDCLRLEMDEYGHSDLDLNFKLYLLDTLGNEYVGKAQDCLVFAKGKFLWKVKNK